MLMRLENNTEYLLNVSVVWADGGDAGAGLCKMVVLNII